MKIADIKVGEHYAVGGSSWAPRHVVLEVGPMEFKSYSNGFFSAHMTTRRAVRVQLVGPDGSPIGQPKVVMPQQVLHPWAVEQAKIDAEADVEARRRARGEAIRHFLTGVGVDAKQMRVNPQGGIGGLTVASFEGVIDAPEGGW